jgi:hypothetical protein
LQNENIKRKIGGSNYDSLENKNVSRS